MSVSANGQAPRALDVYIGSFRTRSFGVWWDGRQLVYESFQPGYEHRQQRVVTPSESDWRDFWATMDELGVWQWRERYDPHEHTEPGAVIRDGTHWSLTLEHGDRRVESSGENTGPDSARLDESTAFAEFLRAVSHLVGDRDFT